jgi:hypothetical protein
MPLESVFPIKKTKDALYSLQSAGMLTNCLEIACPIPYFKNVDFIMIEIHGQRFVYGREAVGHESTL